MKNKTQLIDSYKLLIIPLNEVIYYLLTLGNREFLKYWELFERNYFTVSIFEANFQHK